MKRRGLSLVVALALCLNLCPMWTLAAGNGRSAPVEKYLLLNDETFTEVHVISTPWLFDTNGFTLKGSNSTVLQVNKGGELEVRGTVISEKGAAVEVLSGGSLTITEPAYLEGSTCALEVAAGASVQLSAGRYSCGRFPTIQAEDYAALLAEGCAYFDTLGDPLWPVDVAGYTGTITVGPCTSHPDKSYAHTPGSTTHTWTCPYCGTKTTENCTFDIDGQTGRGACVCGNSIKIEAGDQDLVYNGTMQPADVTVTVTLTDGSNQVLARGTDYRVDYGPRQDAGEVTVMVSGLTFNGSFAKTYQISPDQPVLTWNTAAPSQVNYDGSPVEAGDLPSVTIQIASTTDRLEDKLQYSYRKQGDSAYTNGLPTNAGTYEVVVSLPETHNFKAAVSQPVTLIVNKINPIAAAPAATKPAFDYTAQALVTPGALTPAAEKDGAVILFAASQNGPYSTDIPTGVDAKSYGVWYKVEETGSCSAYGPQQVSGVLIQPKGITPNVTLSQSSFVYNGSRQEPVITVEDGTTKIGTDQYTVTWKDDNNPANTDVLKNIGTYTATIQSVPGGNYTFTATAQVKITEAAQGGLSITNQPAHVYYGDTFTLHTAGGSEDGTVTWSITSGGGVASIDPATGEVTVNNTGAATVRAERQVPNYGTVSDTWTFTAEKKPVTAVVTAASKTYDGNTDASVTAVLQSGDQVDGDQLRITLAGTFEDANVGTNKRVDVDSTHPTFSGGSGSNYNITYPATVTAAITKAAAALDVSPAAIGNLTYDGSQQALITGGSTVGNIGTIEYRLDTDSEYSTAIPTAADAGTHTVWYRVEGTGNYTGIAPVSIPVVIQKATPDITAPTASGTAGQTLSQIPLNNGGAALGGAPVSGSFAWLDDSIQAVSGVAYDVIFTPDDINNYNTVRIQVTPVPSAGGGSTPSDPPAASNSLPTRTTVRNGTASTVLSDADGSKLVQEAVANQSESVVIKPEITGDVTKTEISIPASTVSQLQSRTNAALTVSSPVADVTIPHGALETLAQAGGAVSVAAEQVGQSVVLTLTAGGKKVESVPDGLTLSVPVEEASPGTVAVLVHSDGRREVVRKSVAGEGMLNVPLDGSATIEIVDNSKAFTDVPSDNWAADAVAFASARELFSGTGEDTFGPDEPLSRGMLATVLYSLEGSPVQDETGEFSDVSSDAWYAGGVAWAVANGIAEGYDNGQFGPDDSITREQFVVMVWKYAGSPEAAGQTLAFADADQISDYAQQALCWAVENNILSGCADGLLAPGGPATRAQAALMLKNFMEGA